MLLEENSGIVWCSVTAFYDPMLISPLHNSTPKNVLFLLDHIMQRLLIKEKQVHILSVLWRLCPWNKLEEEEESEASHCTEKLENAKLSQNFRGQKTDLIKESPFIIVKWWLFTESIGFFFFSLFNNSLFLTHLDCVAQQCWKSPRSKIGKLTSFTSDCSKARLYENVLE